MAVENANYSILVVINPSVVRDRTTAEVIIRSAACQRDLEVDILWFQTMNGAAAAAASCNEEIIVVPGTDFDASKFRHGVIRVDFGQCAPDRSLGVNVHIRGRGLDGLKFAVDSLYHRRFHPARVVRYGLHHDQRVEVRIPDGDGPFDVVLLIHGGYWRSRWELDLMDAVAVDLTSRGYATWNVEYRRPEDDSWAATADDIAAALAATKTAPECLKLNSIVVVGHSAGGQLALRLAADMAASDLSPRLVVSLAGVVDLQMADERWLSEGAVSNAIGGVYVESKEIYIESSPICRLPIGVPHILVCATSDDSNLVEMNRGYFAAAASRDAVEMIEGDGGHFDLIDPSSRIWQTLVAAMANAIAEG